MEQDAPTNSADSIPRSRPIARSAVAAGVLLVVILYAISIVAGKIPAQRKLVGADVVILVVGILIGTVLLRPELLDRLKHFKLGSLEFELQQLQKNQKTQQDELDDVRFVLTLLLQDPEKEHLRKLKSGDTENYVGRHELRSELRRLRTLGLIANLQDQQISKIKDGQKVNLKTIVQLTERGKQYLEKIGDFEQ
jgi:hypothetical protein